MKKRDWVDIGLVFVGWGSGWFWVKFLSGLFSQSSDMIAAIWSVLGALILIIAGISKNK